MLLKLFSSILVTGCFGITDFSISLLCNPLVGQPLICPMIAHQKITSFCKWGMKRGTVRWCSYKDSFPLLFFSFNPIIFLCFHLPLSLMPWAHLHPSASRLALGTSLSTALALCWLGSCCSRWECCSTPTGGDVLENWQKIKNAEDEPLGSA